MLSSTARQLRRVFSVETARCLSTVSLSRPLPSSEGSQASEYTWGAAALGVFLGSALVSNTALAEQLDGPSPSDVPEAPHKQQGWHLLDPATRRRTFYKYERRIRALSQPDKVFHYFATKTLEDGTRVMTADDLIRAVVAVFPPEDSDEYRSGGLAGEPSRPPAKKARLSGGDNPKADTTLAAFDADLNGISYPEYMLLLTFLKFPAQDVKIVFSMFDLDGSGKVDAKEFDEIVAALQTKLKRGSSVQRTGSNISMADSSQGLKKRFFGEKGDKSLSLSDFAKFIESMHEELLRLEFEHYDLDENETILGVDFARSILSAVDLSLIDTYLDRAADLPDKIASAKVTYDDFRHFAKLYQHVHSLAVALDFFHNINGKLERTDFKRATKIVTGQEIPDHLVEIVYGMFDLDGDDNLSSKELIAVLRKREGGKGNRSSEDDDDGKSQSLFSCFYDCAFNKTRT